MTTEETKEQSINRNIVECKDDRSSSYPDVIEVLIETLWNVKQGQYQNLAQFQNRINRNIVECKDSTSRQIRVFCNSINRNIVECKADAHSPGEKRKCLY